MKKILKIGGAVAAIANWRRRRYFTFMECDSTEQPKKDSIRHHHKKQKGPSSLTQFTITIENSHTSKYSTVGWKRREGKQNNAL